MPKIERIDTARMDRLERVALERHNTVLEKLDGIVDRLARLESVTALVLAHVSTENQTYARMQRDLDSLDRRIAILERGESGVSHE